MLAKLQQHIAPPAATDLRRHTHILFILPPAGQISRQWPAADVLVTLLKRRNAKLADLEKTPMSATLDGGTLATWMMLAADKASFELNAALRAGLQTLLTENPRDIALAVFGSEAQRARAARLVVYGAWVNGAVLPERKKAPVRKPLQSISLYGYHDKEGYAAERACAAGNVLCRELTVLPPNELTPALYRKRLRTLAREQGWRRREYGYAELRKIGAGAFCAVAQGSADADAAIVHLRYAPARARFNAALVGKGICFDTGGHNLKPARYMYSMHEDMNGSAVALGILLGATQRKLPIAIDCWLALAQNHISPAGYKQNDVVTALNGTSIEVMHTDAEGRMVLADTLTLASRVRPDLIVDFATLTGTMHMALGGRYSGIFATSDELGQQAVAAGRRSGERVCAFPADADYDGGLDSAIADVKQCSLDSEADHILATRFLGRFTAGLPWIHVDLSASNCKGGLGAVASDVTGFGVAWGLALVEDIMTRKS